MGKQKSFSLTISLKPYKTSRNLHFYLFKKSPILSGVQEFLLQIVWSSNSSYTTVTAFLFLHGVTDTTHGFNVAFLTFYIKLAT